MLDQKLGPYKVTEEIGAGGMATVYRAYQASMDRHVAIKVIRNSILHDATLRERFRREARLIARLEHPHLLPVYDFDGDHDPPYIVMRYLEGGTLKQILAQGELPQAEILFTLRQVASASLPHGVTAPTPEITTLRITASRQEQRAAALARRYCSASCSSRARSSLATSTSLSEIGRASLLMRRIRPLSTWRGPTSTNVSTPCAIISRTERVHCTGRVRCSTSSWRRSSTVVIAWALILAIIGIWGGLKGMRASSSASS